MKEVQQKLILDKAIRVLFTHCTLSGNEAELLGRSNSIVGFCGRHYYIFDGTKLLENVGFLCWIFACLKNKNLLSLEELKEDRFGNRWTDLNYDVVMLVAMANAVGWMETIKADSGKKDDYIVRNHLR